MNVIWRGASVENALSTSLNLTNDASDYTSFCQKYFYSAIASK